MSIRHFTIIVASHTLVTYAAIQNGSQVVEKVNKLHACTADDSKVWLTKIIIIIIALQHELANGEQVNGVDKIRNQ